MKSWLVTSSFEEPVGTSVPFPSQPSSYLEPEVRVLRSRGQLNEYVLEDISVAGLLWTLTLTWCSLEEHLAIGLKTTEWKTKR